MFGKKDQDLLAEAYGKVLNEGLFDAFKKKEPSSPTQAPAASPAETEPGGSYPVVQPDMIRFQQISNPKGNGDAYSFTIGGMDGGGILVNGNNVLFRNSDKQNTISSEIDYPETNDNTYKEPLNPFNGKQFSGGLEGFKKELLKILNTDEMVEYMKQRGVDEGKRQDSIFARRQAEREKASRK